ncbi:MAG: membrane protein insertase YidC [Bdellovibrionales bacterium]|nr:membrane protein insertase YidC [Bdellovibrionales bacterium]
MSQEQQPSFLDSKTILAIALVGLSWVAWQSYMTKKYPRADEQNPQQVEQSVTGGEAKMAEGTAGEGNGGAAVDKPEAKVDGAVSAPAEPVASKAESLVHFEDDHWSFDISSKGMGIRNLSLKNYTDREKQPVSIGGASAEAMFATNLIGRRGDLDFSIEQISPGEFKGTANTEAGQIIKLVRVKSAQYLLENEIIASGLTGAFVGLRTAIGDRIVKAESSGFMMPAFDQQEFYVHAKGGSERLVVNPSDLGEIERTLTQVHVAALGNHYFAQAVIDNSDVMPELKSFGDAQAGLVTGWVQHTMLNKADAFKVRYQTFAGPKSFSLLEKIDPELAQIVNFGMFSWIAKHILTLMKWFFSLVGNWGIAIIILTIIVRVFVLPFAVMSYKSMKNMQAIQPQIKALREKYGEDKARLNQEMMVLMKTHKVNPLGGCLPMLLQFPIFIALYQVLGQSIELYQAPFGLWIPDLSLKDPFYILPVLMGVTMFIQQKITPNTMDPAQAKVLMFMPIVFTFFMLSLPSGLTLYIFVSTLFGILQQIYFMRDTKTNLKTVEVTAK